MKKNAGLWIVIVFSIWILTACSTQANAHGISALTPTVKPVQAQPTDTQITYSDPFAYCAAVGTVDTPDARYTGPKISQEIIAGYKSAAGLADSTEPMDMFMKTTIWRCMNHQVVACNFGANLPCDSKANTDKTPTQAMDDYCKANPDAESMPMVVTGHDTIYSWHCVKDTPQVLAQIGKVDAAGYLAQIWYPITSGSSK
jgi:hypothetical protein